MEELLEELLADFQSISKRNEFMKLKMPHFIVKVEQTLLKQILA